MVSVVGWARTSSPIRTCSLRSSARPSSSPDDVVLEVGGGEGALTAELAPRVGHVHVVELDRRLRPALEAVAAEHRERRAALRRRDAARPRRARARARPDGRQPALLDRDAADPAHDRRAARARALDPDGPARDRRPAARRARARASTARRACSSSSPARCACCAAVDRGGVHARGRGSTRRCSASSGSGPAPAPEVARAGPRRVRPPAQVAGPLARARPPRRPRRGPRGARASSGWRRTRAPSSSRPAQFVALAERRRRSSGSLRAPAKLNLCLYLGRPRATTGCTSCARCSARCVLSDRIEVSRAAGEADEVVCAGRRGPEPGRRSRSRRCGRAAGSRPPLRVEIEKRIPVAAGLGGGSADAAAVLRLAGGRGRRSRRRSRPGSAPTCPRSSSPAFALVSGAGEAVEPLPAPGEFAVVLIPDERGSRHRRGLRARPTRSGSAASRGELDELAGAAARGGRRRRLAARVPRAARQRPRAGGDLAAPADRRGAGGARGGGRGARAGHRLGADRGRALRGHRRRRRRGGGAAAALRERDRHRRRSGSDNRPVRLGGDSRTGASETIRLAALIGVFARRLHRLPAARARASTSRAGSRTSPRTSATSPTLLVGLLAFARDRRLRRPRLPGRDGGDHRRRARRPGRELGRADARGRLVLRLGRRHGQLPARHSGSGATSSSGTGPRCGSPTSASPRSRSTSSATAARRS